MAAKQQLPEGITRRTIRRKDGTTYDRYRARYPDPTRGGTTQIEQTFTTLREAKQWRQRAMAAVDQGTHISPRDSARLFSSVVDEWRDTWGGLEPKTTLGYDSILQRHIAPTWGGVKVWLLTPGAVQAWVNDLAVNRQANTVVHIHSVMRAVLDLAVTPALHPHQSRHWRQAPRRAQPTNASST